MTHRPPPCLPKELQLTLQQDINLIFILWYLSFTDMRRNLIKMQYLLMELCCVVESVRVFTDWVMFAKIIWRNHQECLQPSFSYQMKCNSRSTIFTPLVQPVYAYKFVYIRHFVLFYFMIL